MEENVAKIINASTFSGEISDDLRTVCEDYFCANTENESDSDSDVELEQEADLAVHLPQEPQEVEHIQTIDNILNLEVS